MAGSFTKVSVTMTTNKMGMDGSSRFSASLHAAASEIDRNRTRSHTSGIRSRSDAFWSGCTYSKARESAPAYGATSTSSDTW